MTIGGFYNIMIIEFKSNKLMKLCKKEKKARKKLGADVARSLIRRLYQLQAFENLEEVPYSPPFRRHKLSGDYEGCFAVDLKGAYRIVFKPIIDNDKTIEEIELSEVKKITIWEVIDYHD